MQCAALQGFLWKHIKRREENFVGIECAGKLIPIFFLSSHGSEESGASFSITWKHGLYPFHLKTCLALSCLL